MAEHRSISKQSRLHSRKQELGKSGKKTENGIQKSLTFQKADRNHSFDLRKREGYVKVASLSYSILNMVGLHDPKGLLQPKLFGESMKLDTENHMALV